MSSFDSDIRPLFRDKDIQAMKMFREFDLSLYEDVSKYAEDILSVVADGTMPCDGKWSQDMIDTFRSWLEGGKNP
ncbi:MAG: hypothetical protein EON58_00935 [Alphaproteobacteria bacterium]|nr:MAG: hypothetical protein EON58_00935 [Alphaproteobacteria bacterium]